MLGFAALDEGTIHAGIARLAQAVDALAKSSMSRRPEAPDSNGAIRAP
jgi:hypothetical protein